MKSARQTAILDIIEKENIETQEEMAEALRQRGMNVTQATVSRDIKELRLIKTLSPEGVYRYAAPEIVQHSLNDRFARMLKESMLSAEYSGTTIVVKTLSGSANMAAEALDSLQWPEVLGSIAGDNTIFLVCKTPDDAPMLVARLRALIR